MEKIEHYMLPKVTEDLYRNEAISSIALTKGIAEKINAIIDVLNEIENEHLDKFQEQDGKINKAIIYIKDNLANTINDLLNIMRDNGELDSIISEVLNTLSSKIDAIYNSRIVSVKEYGALGNGIQDDTKAIQEAINDANKLGRIVKIPKGRYLISSPILLNGCSLEGEPCNIFNSTGSVIICRTKDFTAIKQGSNTVKDIQFNLSNILVKDANVGMELNYVINSKFDNLYFDSCNTGLVLGNGTTVGSMFNQFNNLYMSNCEVGIESSSNSYFNNNLFNNGYIQGNKYAMKLAVKGGYGAVNNTFNNVEFKSNTGRGIILDRCINTTFNRCYFECAGNVLRTLSYCDVELNNCVYALYKVVNNYNDVNVIFAEGGFRAKFDNGTIFLSDQYQDLTFFGCENDSVYQNIHLFKPIAKNSSVSGFTFFDKPINEMKVA